MKESQAAMTFYKKEEVKDFLLLIEKLKHLHYVKYGTKITNDKIAKDILAKGLQDYIDLL